MSNFNCKIKGESFVYLLSGSFITFVIFWIIIRVERERKLGVSVDSVINESQELNEYMLGKVIEHIFQKSY